MLLHGLDIQTHQLEFLTEGRPLRYKLILSKEDHSRRLLVFQIQISEANQSSLAFQTDFGTSACLCAVEID